MQIERACNKADRQEVGLSWIPYENVLGQNQPDEDTLSLILSHVHLPDKEKRSPVFYPPRALSLSEQSLMPVPAGAKDGGAFVRVLKDFKNEYAHLESQGNHDGEEKFTAFYHLYWKYAWAIPSTYGEKGVSLFDQWKAIAAMAFASGDAWENGPANHFTLVGGDIPGIQDFVYTITSKGAAKGLRGRRRRTTGCNCIRVRRPMTLVNRNAPQGMARNCPASDATPSRS